MATRALTLFARRASQDQASLLKSDRSWRAIFANQDAEEIWRSLSDLTRRAGSACSDQATQELFLHLLATERFTFYQEQDYSDEEIQQDLLSLL
ncbi:MAG TPA: hypothetical protein VID27_03575 [Blastocatellia bacterium]|jgi:hypothetical protein